MSDTFAVPGGLLAMTSPGSIRVETAMALAGTMKLCVERQLPVTLQHFGGALVDKARNDAGRACLQNGAGYVLYIDGDMVFTPDAVFAIVQSAFTKGKDFDIVGGYCVAGDTRILHRHGYDRIEDLVGREVEIFNGKKWSKVTPFQTGADRSLVRVSFSDGSHLDCTPDHRFSVKWYRKADQYQIVAAKDLRVGHHLPSFRSPSDIAGVREPEAYTYGAFLGDGAWYARNEGGYRREIALYPGKHHLPVTGSRGTGHATGGAVTVTLGHLDDDKLASLKQPGLPDWVFQMDLESTLDFLAGWFDTDGCTLRGENTGGGLVLDMNGEQRARDAQLLLRRVGFSYISVRKTGSRGETTTPGFVRRDDAFRIQVLGAEAGILQGHRVRSDRTPQLERFHRQVTVTAIEPLPGTHDTFCFTEPERGMGVFGNVLTHQCVLRGGAVPTIDTGTGTWESHYPGSGILEVIRTGAAFLLVKRHVFEKMPAPWFSTRQPNRWLDAFLEVDNLARTKMSGKNPFRDLPGRPWEALLEAASKDSQSAQGVQYEIGEDSGFCDRAKLHGFRIGVDTDISIGHLDSIVLTGETHKERMDQRAKEHRQLHGVLK